MALNYQVSYGTSSNGPWTLFNTATTNTDVITGLSANTNYYAQIVTVDSTSGRTSLPVVSGPYLTAVPGVVLTMQVLSTTATSVTFGWNAAPFTYDAFGLFYASAVVGSPTVVWSTTQPVEGPAKFWTVTVSGLATGVYNFTVAGHIVGQPTYQGFSSLLGVSFGLPVPASVGAIVQGTYSTSNWLAPAWTIPSGAIDVKVEVATAAGGPFTPATLTFDPGTSLKWAGVTGLSPNTNYFIRVTPFNTAGTGPSSVGGPFLTKPTPPTGTIQIDWAGVYRFEMMPVGTTAHCAVYYDVWHYNSITGVTRANALINNVEPIYAIMKGMFASEMNNAPSIKTVINPDGSKANCFMHFDSPAPNGVSTGGSMLVGHAGCTNADIMFEEAPPAGTFSAAQVQTFDLATYVAEGSEVFMPNLKGMPDCDGTGFGEGLSLYLTDTIVPTSVDQGGYVFYYMNVTSPVDGTIQRDYINNNSPISDFTGIACYVVYFYYLVTQLGFTMAQICAAINTITRDNPLTPNSINGRMIYNILSHNTTDPFPAFITLLRQKFPNPSQIPQIGFNPFL